MNVGKIEQLTTTAEVINTAMGRFSKGERLVARLEASRSLPTPHTWKNKVYDLSREAALLSEPPTPESLRVLASKLEALSTFLFERAAQLDEAK